MFLQTARPCESEGRAGYRPARQWA